MRAEERQGLITESEDWVQIKENEDIELEAGATYSFFATYDQEMNTYFLNGYQYGALLLLDGEQSVTKNNLPDDTIGKAWKVKNISSNEEHNLSDYLKNNLGITLKVSE